eukprot:g43010.t1
MFGVQTMERPCVDNGRNPHEVSNEETSEDEMDAADVADSMPLSPEEEGELQLRHSGYKKQTKIWCKLPVSNTELEELDLSLTGPKRNVVSHLVISRVKDVSEQGQNILKRKSDQQEVTVYMGTNDLGVEGDGSWPEPERELS